MLGGPVILVVTEIVKLAPMIGPEAWFRTRVLETMDMVSVNSIQARYIAPVGSWYLLKVISTFGPLDVSTVTYCVIESFPVQVH